MHPGMEAWGVGKGGREARKGHVGHRLPGRDPGRALRVPMTMPRTLWGQLDRPDLETMAQAPAPPSEADLAEVRQRLRRVLPEDRVRWDRETRLAYSYDATGERHWPHAVASPLEAAEVGVILAAAADKTLPILPRGAATNLSGGTVPLYGGLVLALGRLQGPLALDVPHLQAAVEAGWVNANLQAALARVGMFFPPDPSSHRISTVGGNVSENSGGPHCVKYGVTVSHVLAVAGFLVDGTPVRLARPALPGDLDLLGVVVGSEGTLMVVTSAILALRALPRGTGTALLAFATPQDALGAVSAIVAAHLEPSCLELLDAATIRLVEPFAQAGYPLEAGAVLLAEVEGDAPERAEAMREVEAVAAGHGALSVRVAGSADEAERLWIGRRVAYGALARQSAHVFVQDVTVPRPLLPEMLETVNAIAARYHLQVLTVAHAGDGNLHPTIAYDPADPEQVERLRQADAEILAAAAARSGSITGEHGVGIDKLEHLALMYSAAERARMAAVKRAFDPHGKLNPGKAIWTRDAGSDAAVAPRPIWSPTSVEEVRQAVMEARHQGIRLTPTGAGRRAPARRHPLVMCEVTGIQELMVDNLTVTVGAGMRVGELRAALSPYGLTWIADPVAEDETVGGVVASAWPLFAEAGFGPLRDQVLGVRVVDGRADALTFGRPVIKNVAGYDMTKLFVGSAGRLGVLTALTLRLRPARPLTWRRRDGSWAEQALHAWRALARPDRPVVVMGRADGLWTAWQRDPGSEFGVESADPQTEWTRDLQAALRGGAVFADIGRTAAASPGALFWWPESGVALAPKDRWDGGAGRTVGWGEAPPPLDQVAGRLGEQIVAAFDPDNVFGGRPDA